MLVFFSFKLEESPQKKKKKEHTREDEQKLVNLIFNLPLELLQQRMIYALTKNYNEDTIGEFLSKNGQTKKQTNETKLKMCQRVALGILTGRLPPCPKCEIGRLRNIDNKVKCPGYWSQGNIINCTYVEDLNKKIIPRWIPLNDEVATLILRTTKLLNDFEIYKIPKESEVKGKKMIKQTENESNEAEKKKKENLSAKQEFELKQENKLKKQVKRIKEEFKKQHQKIKVEIIVASKKKKFDRAKSFLNDILEKEVMDSLSDLQIKGLERDYISVRKY